MSIVRQSVDAVRRATRAFFSSHLSLQWRQGPKVALVERGRSAAPSPKELAERRAQEELALILRELAEVLDEMPDVRESLRHLVFVEQSLQQQGLAALYQVPQDVLHTALDQFEGLISNWSPAGLASLRSRMAVALADRHAHESDSQQSPTAPAVAPAGGHRPTADPRVSVREP
jgi:hypothetical protein